MIFIIYKYLSNILYFPILFYFFIRFLLSKETKKSLLEKFFLKKNKRPNGKIIWINGVSIGEAKTGMIIAEQILKKDPHTKILFSTSTITAHKQIFNQNKKIILIYTPVDINFIIKKFINHWKPDQTIFLESEIWPNIINELKNKRIKFQIINGRMSKKSFYLWKKISYFSKSIFSNIYFCSVQDYKSEERYRQLGVKNVSNIGNLKFLSRKPFVDKKKLNLLNKSIENRIVITLFSSHENEELVLIETFKILKKEYPKILFVVIPRHIYKINKIENNLIKNNIKYAIRSTNKKRIESQDFYLVDSYGELGLFFKISDIAVIGGSFEKIGGHNPIEASYFNCVLIFGPHMFNFEDIKLEILSKNAGFEAKNSKELSRKIMILLKNKKIKINMIKKFKELCILESIKAKEILNKIN
ncbi:MAG: 3-deoxy-D-manno-octulosonic acid transferase [Alphaproteobacteria bacterium]